MFLRELTAVVSSLKGVGKISSGILSAAGIKTVGHLLLHKPRGYEDRQAAIPLASAGSGGTVKNGMIEIQGEHRKKIADALNELGYKTKIAGG